MEYVERLVEYVELLSVKPVSSGSLACNGEAGSATRLLLQGVLEGRG